MPEIWAFEVANSVFVSFVKRKRITEAQIQEYIQRLKALPIRLGPSDLWLNVALETQARRWNVTAYDAAYLELAKRLSLPLATADDDLKKAAIAEGIEIA